MLSLALIKSAAVVAGLSGLAIGAFLQSTAPEVPAVSMRNVAMPDGNNLLVATHEVTRAQWRACVEAGACEAIEHPNRAGAEMPMTGVNHIDVEAYVA